MKSLTRTLVVAFSLALITFASMPAASAHAAKPAAKSSIYGTPAQLVEDLKAIGIDLAGDKFTKETVLKRTPHTTNPVYYEYHFANAMVLIRRDGSSIENGQITAPGVEPNATEQPVVKGSPLQLGTFGKTVSGGRKAIIARYGTKYIEVLPQSERGQIDAWIHYVVLIKGKTTSMWNLIFYFDKAGKFQSLVFGMPCKEISLVRVSGQGEGAKVVSANMPLYNDLLSIGFNVGMKTSRPDVIKQGKPGGSDDYRGTNKLLFTNAEISLFPSGVIESVYLNQHHETEKRGVWGMFRRSTNKRQVPVPTNAVTGAMEKGREAVFARYGKPNGAGSSTEDSSYSDFHYVYYLAVTDDNRTFIVFADFIRSSSPEIRFVANGYSFPAYVYMQGKT
jgi:hypothetical protein